MDSRLFLGVAHGGTCRHSITGGLPRCTGGSVTYLGIRTLQQGGRARWRWMLGHDLEKPTDPGILRLKLSIVPAIA